MKKTASLPIATRSAKKHKTERLKIYSYYLLKKTNVELLLHYIKRFSG